MIAETDTGDRARECRATRSAIDAHFRGRPASSAERRMRLHVSGCAACRAYYERHLLLAAADPGVALHAHERLARGLGLGRVAAGARAPFGWRWALGAAAALGLFALVGVRLGRPRGPEPQARGAASPPSQLLVYAIGPRGSAAVRVTAGTRLERDGRLAFAYVNIAHNRRLMVFAVDEHRHVFWYHPAWQNVGDNPVGVPIAADEAVHEIPQAVRHRFEGQRLQLFGVFDDRDTSVRDVEAAVVRAPLDARGELALTLPAAEITSLPLTLSGSP